MTDLWRRFELTESDRDDNTRIIIVEPEDIPIGMVVDPRSSEVLAGCRQRLSSRCLTLGLSQAAVASIPSTSRASASLGDGKLLILLDLEKVLTAAAS